MKNIWKIALMVAALMTSCSQPDIDELNPNEGANGKEIKFYTEANRTTYFEGEGLGVNWKTGDKVSIRISDANVTSTNNVTRKRGNYQATQSGATTSFERNDTFGDEMTWIDESVGDTYVSAFYPATANYSPKAVALQPFAEQTQSVANNHDHIGDIMVMKTSKMCFKVGESKPEAVGLTFRNIYSIVELTLKGNGEEVSQITLTSNSPLVLSAQTNANLFTTFEEDDANGIKFAASNFSNSAVLNMETPAVLTAEGVKFYFVVLPGSHADGDIQVIVKTNEDKRTLVMGAIDFKMNKVYRPSLAYSQFVADDTKYATIKHIFSDSYSFPVPFENGAKVILERYNYPMANVPTLLTGFDVATALPSKYPTTNKIVALTEGYAYMMVGASGSNMSANLEKATTWFAEKGWEPATTIPTEQLTTIPTSDVLYYQTTSEHGAMVLYKKYLTVGEEFDLTEYYTIVKNFQSIRPVAKEIVNEPGKITVGLNFMDNAQGWNVETSFNNVSKNAYEGTKSYLFPDNTSYNMEFSRTVNEADATKGGGCALHKDGYLMMYVRYSTAESIGLPAIEGYKLSAVSGELNADVTGATVVISSVAAPAESVNMGEVFTFDTKTVGNKKWSVSATNTLANTMYYFYGTDNVSGSQDLRIKYMTLVYDKAE